MEPGSRSVEHRIEVAGVETAVLEQPGEGTPVLLVHGVPNGAGMWQPFLERIGARTLRADLPGFGHSARPDLEAFDGSVDALADWAEALIDALELERYSLVVHDWGAVGLLAAARHPERVERIVALNPVPFEYDYRWHWIGQIWRNRRVGGFFTGASANRFMTAAILRQARPGWRRMPDYFLDDCLREWDRGKSRAILSLYRSADPDVLGRHGDTLGALSSPALVLWGEHDPYIPNGFGPRYAERLGDAELERYPDAGHWAWIDRPDVIDRTVAFVRR